MKGCSFGEFMDDLLACGGPEKEFLYRGRRYMVETDYNEEHHCPEMVVFDCEDEDAPYIFRCLGKDAMELAAKFSEAKIFDGRTISEAEGEIEVLYG